MMCLNEEDFNRYLDNELDHAEREEILAHIASCRPCKERLNQLELLERDLRKCLVGKRPKAKVVNATNALSCPSEQDLLAYLSHALSPRNSGEIESHLEHCDSCIEHLNLLAKINTSLQPQVLEPVPQELKDIVSQMWQHTATELDKEKHKVSPFKLVIRLVTTGLEILRDSIVPSDIELNLFPSPTFAGAFRSGDATPMGGRSEVLVAKKQIADKNLQVKLEIRKEGNLLVSMIVTLSKGETPFSGTRVSLIKNGLLFHSKKTGSRGNIEFSNIPPGQYVLKVSSEVIEWPIEIKDH